MPGDDSRSVKSTKAVVYARTRCFDRVAASPRSRCKVESELQAVIETMEAAGADQRAGASFDDRPEAMSMLLLHALSRAKRTPDTVHVGERLANVSHN